MANLPSFTLNNGTKIPSVGLGCWMGAPGGEERVNRMCTKALKHGYRHFDTAAGYANEKQVGESIKNAGIARSELYVTTKLGAAHDKVEESLDVSLKLLDCEYLDLYLMHWPEARVNGKCLLPHEYPTIVDTWKYMEKLLATGRVKAIGVSNFSIKTLEILLTQCEVVPAVNQVEMHPCLPQEELKAYCEKKGIHLTAYTPLGRDINIFGELETVKVIEKRLEATTAQVLLAWGVQRGISVIPKSENEERLKQNITLPQLSTLDMEHLNAIHKQPGMHRSLVKYHSDDVGGRGPGVFGWTYEELGWNMVQGGIVPDNSK